MPGAAHTLERHGNPLNTGETKQHKGGNQGRGSRSRTWMCLFSQEHPVLLRVTAIEMVRVQRLNQYAVRGHTAALIVLLGALGALCVWSSCL